MQNITGLQDITFTLEKIGWINRKKSTLSDEQKKDISKLPKETQKQIAKKILEKKEEDKKYLLHIWGIMLEEKIKAANLPKEALNKILELVSLIKNGSPVVYDITSKVEDLKETIKEAEQKETQKKKKEEQQKKEQETGDSFLDITYSQINPLTKIRYVKEEFERATKDYFENKILPDLVTAEQKPIIPVEPKREYSKKQGSSYPKAFQELEKKFEKKWQDLLIKKIQKQQAQKGLKVQTAEEISLSHENLPNMKKKIILRALQSENPELFQQQKDEERATYEAQLKRNIERQLRKRAEKEAKRAKRAARIAKQEAAGHNAPKKRSNVEKILEKGQKKEEGKPKNKSTTGLLKTLKKTEQKISVTPRETLHSP